MNDRFYVVPKTNVPNLLGSCTYKLDLLGASELKYLIYNARRTRFTVEAGPPHGYEGGGSGRSHPENADPDQQVAKKDEAKYTLLVEWTNQQK